MSGSFSYSHSWKRLFFCKAFPDIVHLLFDGDVIRYE